MDWNTYEETTKTIYQTLGNEDNVSIECFGRKCKCTGKSGVKHQLDVFTSHKTGLKDYKTYIECKHWKTKKIDKDVVMKVSSIVEDCNLDKGIIVTINEFTPDAVKYAKSKNIGLVQLRKPLPEDKINRVWDIHIDLSMNYLNMMLNHWSRLEP